MHVISQSPDFRCLVTASSIACRRCPSGFILLDRREERVGIPGVSRGLRCRRASPSCGIPPPSGRCSEPSRPDRGPAPLPRSPPTARFPQSRAAGSDAGRSLLPSRSSAGSYHAHTVSLCFRSSTCRSQPSYRVHIPDSARRHLTWHISQSVEMSRVRVRRRSSKSTGDSKSATVRPTRPISVSDGSAA